MTLERRAREPLLRLAAPPRRRAGPAAGSPGAVAARDAAGGRRRARQPGSWPQPRRPARTAPRAGRAGRGAAAHPAIAGRPAASRRRGTRLDELPRAPRAPSCRRQRSGEPSGAAQQPGAPGAAAPPGCAAAARAWAGERERASWAPPAAVRRPERSRPSSPPASRRRAGTGHDRVVGDGRWQHLPHRRPRHLRIAEHQPSSATRASPRPRRTPPRHVRQYARVHHAAQPPAPVSDQAERQRVLADQIAARRCEVHTEPGQEAGHRPGRRAAAQAQGDHHEQHQVGCARRRAAAACSRPSAGAPAQRRARRRTGSRASPAAHGRGRPGQSASRARGGAGRRGCRRVSAGLASGSAGASAGRQHGEPGIVARRRHHDADHAQRGEVDVRTDQGQGGQRAGPVLDLADHSDGNARHVRPVMHRGRGHQLLAGDELGALVQYLQLQQPGSAAVPGPVTQPIWPLPASRHADHGGGIGGQQHRAGLRGSPR